jgi:hypothetical protein
MRAFTAAAAFCLLGVLVTAQGQAPNPTNKTGVIGLMHAIHSTNDVEKTLAFYQAVFALNGQVRGFDPKGPRILTNSPTCLAPRGDDAAQGSLQFRAHAVQRSRTADEQAA